MILVDLIGQRLDEENMTPLEALIALALAARLAPTRSDVLLRAVRCTLPDTTRNRLRTCVNRLAKKNVLRKTHSGRHWKAELADHVCVRPPGPMLRAIAHTLLHDEPREL